MPTQSTTCDCTQPHPITLSATFSLDSVVQALADIAGTLSRLEILMATTKDELEAKVAELGHDQARLITEVGALRTTVQELRDAIEAGDLTELAATVDSLDAQIEAISPEAETPPAG